MAHRAMMFRSKHKSEPDSINTLCNLFGVKIDIDACRLKYVCRSRTARHCTVAVLGNFNPRCSRYQSTTGGDIKRTAAITTGTDNIHQVAALTFHSTGKLTHNLCGSRHFFNGFSLDTQCHQQTTDLCISTFTRHDFTHRVDHFFSGQCITIDHFGYSLLNFYWLIHLALLRNCCSMSCP